MTCVLFTQPYPVLASNEPLPPLYVNSSFATPSGMASLTTKRQSEVMR